jgi:hypothetical protein
MKRSQQALTATLVLVAAAGRNCSFGQGLSDKDYLAALLPAELLRYAGVEVPSRENIRILSNSTGRYLEFRLVPGQAKKNNGIRAEITVNYPFKAGDIVRYKWKMRLPQDFKADEPRNR